MLLVLFEFELPPQATSMTASGMATIAKMNRRIVLAFQTPFECYLTTCLALTQTVLPQGRFVQITSTTARKMQNISRVMLEYFRQRARMMCSEN